MTWKDSLGGGRWPSREEGPCERGLEAGGLLEPLRSYQQTSRPTQGLSAALDNPPCPPSLSASKYSSGPWEHSSKAPGRMQRDLRMLRLIVPKWDHHSHFADQQTETQGNETAQPKSNSLKQPCLLQPHQFPKGHHQFQ